jgi:hypothetical protein
MVDYFSALIGPFPYDRLAHVQSTTIFGGAENPTAIFYDEKAYRNQRLGEQTVAHETAHQWFGDAVTETDWHHLWLSEGFATYNAALWIRHADGDSAPRRDAPQYPEVIGPTPPHTRSSYGRRLMGRHSSNCEVRVLRLRAWWVIPTIKAAIVVCPLSRRHLWSPSDFAAVMTAAGTDLWYSSRPTPAGVSAEVRWRRRGRRCTDAAGAAGWWGPATAGLELEVDGRRLRLDVTRAGTSVALDGVRGPKSFGGSTAGRCTSPRWRSRDE